MLWTKSNDQTTIRIENRSHHARVDCPLTYMNCWKLRIAAKILLSRIPWSHHVWARLGVFRHGRMDTASYAQRVFSTHDQIRAEHGIGQGWRGLELGPGDGLASALLAPGGGSSFLTFVDTGPWANRDAAAYKAIAVELSATIKGIPEINGAHDLDEVLELCRARYLTRGVESLRGLADASIDFVWSQAVLEHVRAKDFREMAQELRRISSNNAVHSHRIDFKDHLGGGLNNLRFSTGFWERDWFAYRSGFYTNRLRLSHVIEVFRDAGFVVSVTSVRQWNTLPIDRDLLANEFRGLDDKDLLVSGAHLVLSVMD